jgi:hypothetical protein
MLFRVSNLIALVSLMAFAVNGHEIERNEKMHKRSIQSKDVVSTFQICESKITNYVVTFESACRENHPATLVKALVDIRMSLVGLSTQVNAGVGHWAAADLDTFAHLFCGLLAKLQVLLEIIHSYDRLDSCKDAIFALNEPIKALLTVFENAKINMGALLNVDVDLNLLGSVGIPINVLGLIGVNINL